ncbi:hypothetical protein HMPREF1582_00499 [Gardnerella vaginalis JCP8151A]|nr:hypothetical protein HMPREF1582_00499 [Gardnerella vaginalis JCP8151A]
MLFKILLLLFIAILPLKIMLTHAKYANSKCAKHYINGNIVF